MAGSLEPRRNMTLLESWRLESLESAGIVRRWKALQALMIGPFELLLPCSGLSGIWSWQRGLGGPQCGL